MSNIYIQEPPTYGKVLLKTSVGDIDIELWSKETPKACRNFIQLCLEGYYDDTIFHRVVKEFIAQGGDPTGTGTGGDSIYGYPFKDEFHSRLRFTRRGLVALANAGKDDNGSQFFFTLGACPELQNKHTIFAKVTGETLYNMLKLQDGLIEDERPAYPQKIISTEVLNNPFPDIVPRIKPQPVIKPAEKKKEKKSGVKNFKLLSFGDEAEEDEEETIELNRNFVGKSKSTHDLLDDPKLSAVPAIEKKNNASDTESSLSGDESKQPAEKCLKTANKDLESVKNKLKRGKDESSSDEEYYLGKEEEERKKKKVEEIRKEIRELKKNYQGEKRRREKSPSPEKVEDDTLKLYMEEQEKYKAKKEQIPKKGKSRESFTMSLLSNFQMKLKAVRDKPEEETNSADDEDGHNWMAHKLVFTEEAPVLAKDASTKDDNWFDITDPRNAINKRRREASKDSLQMKEKRTF